MTNFTDVKTFMKTFGQKIPAKPQFPEKKTMQLRYDLIKEELDELEHAMNTNNLKEIADALQIKGSSSYVRVSQLKKQAVQRLIDNVDHSQVVDYLPVE